MVEYSSELAALMPALFPPESLEQIFPEVVAQKGLRQLRIAETEKYAHVTFFFSGGREEPYAGEERILVPSPNVATYDEKPEMSAPEVTDRLVDAIASERFDVIIVNFANTDMVGHTGDIDAARRAVEAVDACLGRLHAAIEKSGGALVITADHGNAEKMMDMESGQAHTAHTLNLVPLVIAEHSLKNTRIPLRIGRLADIAPTLLALLGIDKPAQMTGESLLPKPAAGLQALG
jgi:2,3-bisphosphoglycerate-independent phosphoglycerate mutase